MDELKNPCETCEKAETCKTENCAKWNEWFRRYWRRLRKQWMTSN